MKRSLMLRLPGLRAKWCHPEIGFARDGWDALRMIKTYLDWLKKDIAPKKKEISVVAGGS